MFGIPGLTSLFLPGPNVKTNTGIALAAGGIANALLLGARGRRTWVRAGLALAAVQAVIGGLTLTEHLFGWNLGIDELVATESAGALATTSPNRMGPPASISHLFLGIALLYAHSPHPGRRRLSHALAVAVCSLTLLPVLGYAYGVSQLYEIARYTGIALSTALALFVLALSVIAARPERGLVALVRRSDEAGRLARTMLRVTVLLPLGMGWLLSWSLHANVIDGAFAVSVMVLVLIVGMAALIWWAGKQLAWSLDARLASERALSESDRQKTEFLATLSHELRNPLAPIRFALELLDGPPATAERARSTIGRQVAHLTRLIDDLLDLTRITRNKLQLELQSVELSVVLGDAVDGVRGEIARAGHTLRLELPAERIWLHIDADRIVQVVTNLLNNAVRYTEPGGTITVGATATRSHVEIFVRDTGLGIDPADIGRLFDRFVQVAGSRHGGLGIGLALVKGLVELHGGTVSVRSDGPGTGAEFRVRLARAEAPVVSAGAVTAAPAAAPLRILVADDNVDATELLRTILVQRGHQVAIAFNGEQALAEARTFLPQVGLLDIGMPGMSGYELAAALRKNPETASMFLVAITGWGQDEDRRRAIDAGFDAHITKPARPESLFALFAERFGA